VVLRASSFRTEVLQDYAGGGLARTYPLPTNVARLGGGSALLTTTLGTFGVQLSQ
jgi:hypothetical protein